MEIERETCFVIMPIGTQKLLDGEIAEADLRVKYDYLIKEALLKARPDLEVIRADDIASPGTITTAIITRIMHSTFVLADVTYQNANVFYELGLRHACKPGTIIIRDKASKEIAFDISHLRYIPYSNDLAGLNELAERLKSYFSFYDRNPTMPDNHLLEIAQQTNFLFQNYQEDEEVTPVEVQLIKMALSSPDLFETLLRLQGKDVSPTEALQLLGQHPQFADIFLNAMSKSGELKIPGISSSAGPRKNSSKKRKK